MFFAGFTGWRERSISLNCRQFERGSRTTPPHSRLWRPTGDMVFDGLPRAQLWGPCLSPPPWSAALTATIAGGDFPPSPPFREFRLVEITLNWLDMSLLSGCTRIASDSGGLKSQFLSTAFVTFLRRKFGQSQCIRASCGGVVHSYSARTPVVRRSEVDAYADICQIPSQRRRFLES